MIFFIHSYGITTMKTIAVIENFTDGDFFRLHMFTTFNFITYWMGDMIEDFTYGDIGRWGGLWHNWAFFFPNYLFLFLGYFNFHMWHGDPEFGGWRHGNAAVLDGLMNTGKFPFKWPNILFDENEITMYHTVLMSNMTYGLTTLYYQLVWKGSIRKRVKND